MKKTEYAYSNGGVTIINMLTGEPTSFESGSKDYDFVLENIDDDDQLYRIVTEGIEQFFEKELVNIFDEHKDFIMVAGHKVKNHLVSTWIDIRHKGGDTKAYELFLENLARNPSATSIKELVDFLSHGGFPITEDGCFLAYKGVQPNGYSVKGNLDTVVLEGMTNERGQINNKLGANIRIKRASCDDDRNKTCSFGIHVGTFNYASNWGDRLVLVKVNPEDVVSVPVDGYEKLRCCAYSVEKLYGKAEGGLEQSTANIVEGEIVTADKLVSVADMVKVAIYDYNCFKVCDVERCVRGEYSIALNEVQIINAVKELGMRFVGVDTILV
jgi:hypothetical protein